MASRVLRLALTATAICLTTETPGPAQPVPGGGAPRATPGEPNEAHRGVRVTELPDGTVTNEPVRFFPGHTARVGSIAFSPGGDRLVSVSNDGTLRIWDVGTGKPLRQYRIEKGRGEAALSPDGRSVAASADRTVVLLDLQAGKAVPAGVREFEQVDCGFIGGLRFSPDGRRLASANHDTSAVLWDVETGRLVQRLQGHQDEVRGVAFHPSGTRVVTGSYDRTVRIWDLPSGKPVRVLKGHEKPVLAVAVSPDGATILSGGFDRDARLWDFETGREVRRLHGHTDAINSVAFSPDGRRMATASNDHSVRLWDVDSGEELHRFVGHTDYALDVAFSPDGRFLASSSGGDVQDGRWVAGEDYAIRLWRVPKSATRDRD